MVAKQDDTGRRRPERKRSRRTTVVLVSIALVAAVLAAVETVSGGSAGAVTVPSGFQDTTVFSGLTEPTVIQFGPDGRVWVAEKSGLIKIFRDQNATTPAVFADLRTQVYNWWDRGLLGLALDPQFGQAGHNFVYIQYTYNSQYAAHVAGYTQDSAGNDNCPDSVGATTNGCPGQGRISRLSVNIDGSGNPTFGSETVLIQDWCAQFPSHSIGTVLFGPDGYLYAAGGDGASFTDVDHGQFGGNPCNAGSTESGAARAQSVRTPATASAPSTLDGALIRIDPATGAAAPGNAFTTGASPRTDANERRTIAYGLRNPFRFAFRPGTNELWVGDVGWNDYEEIDRVTDVAASTAPNFGWPCYEGNNENWAYWSPNQALCDSVNGQTTKPYYSNNHSARVTANDACSAPVDGKFASAMTGLSFYQTAGAAAPYPAQYDGALFFTDYNRGCIWYLPKGADGSPDAANPKLFANVRAAASDENGAVDLVTGPGGDLYWVDLFGGAIHKISYINDTPPVAAFTVSASSGAAPLTVAFDAAGSHDPDGTITSYQWDWNNDGTYDATGQTATHTFGVADSGVQTVRLKVTDNGGASTTTTSLIKVGVPPTVTINSPTAGTAWHVGDQISFSGSANSAVDGNLPGSSMTWTVTWFGCTDARARVGCQTRYKDTFTSTGSGTYTVPNWGGAGGDSLLEFKVTAVDGLGIPSVPASLDLYPVLTTLSITSNPTGLKVGTESDTATPYSLSVIVGSRRTVSAADQSGYKFSSWSDGGAASHEVIAPAGGLALNATFTAPPGTPPPTAKPVFNPADKSTWPPGLYEYLVYLLVYEYVSALIRAQKAKVKGKVVTRKKSTKRSTTKAVTKK